MWKTSLYPSGVKVDPYIIHIAVTVSDCHCHIFIQLRLHIISALSLSIDPPSNLNLLNQVLLVFL